VSFGLTYTSKYIFEVFLGIECYVWNVLYLPSLCALNLLTPLLKSVCKGSQPVKFLRHYRCIAVLPMATCWGCSHAYRLFKQKLILSVPVEGMSGFKISYIV